MHGGRSATRRTFRLSGSISTAGSHLDSPLRGAGRRSCNASPKLAARGRRFPRLWASLPQAACERPTRPTSESSTRIRRAPSSVVCRALWALRFWLNSWRGIGDVTVGMARQGYDLQLTRYDEKGWRATFYTTGMEHSITSATASAWERTPWHATQRAAWEALSKTSS